jgi:hypothetical protein
VGRGATRGTMKTIGSHPGANLFRLSIMCILIAIMMMVFFSYVEDAEKEFERISILQTKKIIDSSLTIVFASYAINSRLHELNDLNGANPFVFLKQYEMLPPAYVGELDHDLSADQAPGWYYLSHRRMVVYKPLFNEFDSYFSILLNYQDNNQSGSFEPAGDRFQSLRFVKIADI